MRQKQAVLLPLVQRVPEWVRLQPILAPVYVAIKGRSLAVQGCDRAVMLPRGEEKIYRNCMDKTNINV